MLNLPKLFLVILLFTFMYSDDDYDNYNDYNLAYKIDKVGEATHEYAGYAILGMIAGNIYLGLEGEETYDPQRQELHEDLGNALIWTAISSAVIGSYVYRDDLLDFSDGITKKHIHAFFGLLAVSYMATNLTYDFENHKDNAMLGGSFAITAYTFTLF